MYHVAAPLSLYSPIPGLVTGFANLPTFMLTESTDVLWSLMEFAREVRLLCCNCARFWTVWLSFDKVQCHASRHLTTLHLSPPYLLLLFSLTSSLPSSPSSSLSLSFFPLPLLLSSLISSLPPSSQPVCQLLKTSVEKISNSVGGSVKVTQEQQTWFIESVAK